MARTRKGKKLTEKEFEMIKTLFENKIGLAGIRSVTGRSTSTLSYVRRSNTLEEYQEILTKRAEQKKASSKTNGKTELTSSKEKNSNDDIIARLTRIEDVVMQMKKRWID